MLAELAPPRAAPGGALRRPAYCPALTDVACCVSYACAAARLGNAALRRLFPHEAVSERLRTLHALMHDDVDI